MHMNIKSDKQASYIHESAYMQFFDAYNLTYDANSDEAANRGDHIDNDVSY